MGRGALPDYEILVIARDSADCEEHWTPLVDLPEYEGFGWLMVDHPVAILERQAAVVHITKNGKQNPDYRQMLMNIALLDVPPAVHEFFHDIPRTLEIDDIEAWLAQ